MITENGKEIEIVQIPGSRHLKIQFKQGGQLPEWLSGVYTSYPKAAQDVTIYLNQETGKKKRDG